MDGTLLAGKSRDEIRALVATLSPEELDAVLHPPPECPHCGDLGRCLPNVPPDHPAYNRSMWCICPTGQRQKQEHIEKLTHLAYPEALYDEYSGYSWESWLDLHGSTIPTEDHRAYQVARNFVRIGRVEGRSSLLFHGVKGTGKTGLAVAALNDVLQDDIPALFVKTVTFLRHLKTTFDPRRAVTEDTPTYDKVFERVCKAPFLVLDEVGGENPTPWAVEALYEVIDLRLLSHRLTIFTTNLTESRLAAQLGERIANRLFGEALLLLFTGENLRPNYRRQS